MVRKTIDRTHANHAPEERVERREASYERDEILGPLGGAAHRVVKETYTEEILDDATPSEQVVRDNPRTFL